MADEQPGFFRSALERLNPVNVARRVGENFRQGVGEFRRHPGQEIVQRGVGAIGAALGIPGLGGVADRYFDNRNYRNDYVHRSPEERGSQFGALGDLLGLPDYAAGNSGRQPAPRPAPQGSSPGMPGVTSQWSGAQQHGPQQGQFGALGQLLGLPDYNQGRSGSPGAAASPQQPGSPYTHSGDEINSGPQQTMPTLPAVQAVMPSNTVGNISSGGARDAFAGSSGSSDPVAAMTSLLGLGSQSGGLGSTRADIGDSALRRRVRDQLQQDPNNAAALSLREQFIANRGGGR